MPPQEQTTQTEETRTFDAPEYPNFHSLDAPTYEMGTSYNPGQDEQDENWSSQALFDCFND